MTDSKSIFTLSGSLCCDSDVAEMENSLTSIDGVDEVRSGVSSDKVTVTYHDDSVSEDDIAAKIDDIGGSVEDTVTFDVSN